MSSNTELVMLGFFLGRITRHIHNSECENYTTDAYETSSRGRNSAYPICHSGSGASRRSGTRPWRTSSNEETEAKGG
ncbi:hypothetical protein BH23CHL2_BH23CHL2_30090 [soil metagenome]